MSVPENLSSLKVVELKELCSQFGLSKNGVKKDLIARLEQVRTPIQESFAITDVNIVSDTVTKTPMQPVAPLVDFQPNVEVPEFPTANVSPVKPVEQIPEDISNASLKTTGAENTEKLPETNGTPVIDDATVDDENVEVSFAKNPEPSEKEVVEHPELASTVAPDEVEKPVENEPEPAEKEPEIDLNVSGEVDDDFEIHVEDESLLDEPPADLDTSLKEDLPTVDVVANDKEDTPDKVSDEPKEDGQIDDTEVTVSPAKSPAKEAPVVTEEDKSREVEGTKQRTVIIPAQGDRPSFDIKVVSPVKPASKPVKIRKRHELTQESSETASQDGEGKKKRRWLGNAGSDPNHIVISTDVLKDMIPDLNDSGKKDSQKPKSSPTESSEKTEEDGAPKDASGADKETTISNKSTNGKSGAEEDVEEGEHKSKHAQISFSDVDTKKALAPVKVKGREATGTTTKLFDEPIPRENPDDEVPKARNPVSPIVHVMRLTRPFAVHQLKALLSQHGEIVDEEFWIDEIKSQCYVKYVNNESAEACRAALYGCKWPANNPKTLRLEYVSQLQLDDVRGVLKKQRPRDLSSDDSEKLKFKITRPLSPPGNDTRKRSGGKYSRSPSPRGVRREDGKVARIDRRRDERGGGGRDTGDATREMARREQEARDRDREFRDRKRKEEEERLKKQEEQQPVKLLDDLFRKTKAEPCIYWLPLSEEQMPARDKKRAEEERELKELEEERTRAAFMAGPSGSSPPSRRAHSPRPRGHSGPRRPRDDYRDRGHPRDRNRFRY